MTACYVSWELVLEFVKVLLSWPPVTLLLLVYVIRKFGADIKGLIVRMKEFKAFGHQAAFVTDQSTGVVAEFSGSAVVSVTSSGEGVVTTAVPTHLPSADSPSASGQNPVDGSSALDQIANDPVKAREEIAKWFAVAKHESILNRIFGTQLRLLMILEGKGHDGDTESNLRPYYAEHQRLAAGFNMPASPAPDFVAFLTSVNGLVRREEVEGSAKYYITLGGLGFLLYVRGAYQTVPFRHF